MDATTKNAFNKNPSVSYAPENDEYVIAYESFIYGTNISTIRATVVNADDLSIKQDLLISDARDNEYFPSAAHDTIEGIPFT